MLTQADPVSIMLNMLTRIMDSSLDYWLGRLVHPDLLAFPRLKDDGPEVIIDHYDSLFTLVSGAAALADTQRKAAQLALLITPVVQAQGDLTNWLPVVRHVAVVIYDPVFDDLVLTADLWRSVADCYQGVGDLVRAKHAYQMAAEIVAGTMTEAGVDLYHDLLKEKAIISVHQFRFAEAQAIAENLMMDAYAVNDILTLARGSALAAYGYLQQYRFEEAFMYAQQAYVLWGQLDHASGQARALHYMGETARMTDSFERAALYLERAATYVNQFADPDWQASLAQSIGALALEQQQYDKALTNIKRARNYFRQSDNNRDFLNSTHSLGVVKSRVEQYEEAEALLLEAADGWSWLGGDWKLAEIYYALGQTYAAWGKHCRARVMLDEARRMTRSAEVTNDSSLHYEIDEALAEL